LRLIQAARQSAVAATALCGTDIAQASDGGRIHHVQAANHYHSAIRRHGRRPRLLESQATGDAQRPSRRRAAIASDSRLCAARPALSFIEPVE